jgi:RNA:NAD 2'-phosphotransferase (TPT1/KptA family)
MALPVTTSQTEFRKVVHRAGYSTTQAQVVLRHLPDPIRFQRDAQALLARGVSLDRLIDAVGGSL